MNKKPNKVTHRPCPYPEYPVPSLWFTSVLSRGRGPVAVRSHARSHDERREVIEGRLHRLRVLLVEDVARVLFEDVAELRVVLVLLHPLVDLLRAVVVARVDGDGLDPRLLRRDDLGGPATPTKKFAPLEKLRPALIDSPSAALQ